ncbi:MAG: hypothetical protein AM325_013645 [Candidatus Thorarchaeota archaeon SMTZ1-45]|nr:MAG: hypothetical protein AM325_15165 [Candidatus Thorarchaeota archaeon SMTZ1-45]
MAIESLRFKSDREIKKHFAICCTFVAAMILVPLILEIGIGSWWQHYMIESGFVITIFLLAIWPVF